MKIRFNPESSSELEKALDWYAVRSPDAEQSFASAFDRALAMIAEHPLLFAATQWGCRAYRMEKFPYQIVYRIAGDCVAVVAVAHGKRRPGYWRRRK